MEISGTSKLWERRTRRERGLRYPLCYAPPPSRFTFLVKALLFELLKPDQKSTNHLDAFEENFSPERIVSLKLDVVEDVAVVGESDAVAVVVVPLDRPRPTRPLGNWDNL